MVLNAVYKGKIHLCEDNFHDAVSASHHLQYQPLLNACQAFLTDTLSVSNCVAFRRVADVFMTSVVAEIDRYILDNFRKFRRSDSFLQLSKEELCRYLEDDSLIAEEMEVFEAIRNWIAHEEVREEYKDEIAGLLRHGLLDDEKKVFVAEALPSLQAEIHWERPTSDDTYDANKETFNPTLMRTLAYRPRGYRTYGMLLRGRSNPDRYSNEGTRDKLAFLREREIDDKVDFVGWHAVPPAAFLDSSVHSFVFNNNWFLLGVDSDGFIYGFYCFDTRARRWFMLESPPTTSAIGTYGFLLDDKICLGGGAYVAEDFDSRSEKPSIIDEACFYDISKEEWSEITVEKPKIAHAACCEYKGDGYIIGGHQPRPSVSSQEYYFQEDSPWDDYVFTKTVFVYKSDTNRFLIKTPLNSARYQASAGVLGDYILVVGGLYGESRKAAKACEMYSVQCDQWTYVDGDQTIGDALFVPTASGFALQKDENHPLRYFEVDREGKIQTYEKMYMPAVRWNPGRDHWRDVGSKIMTVALLTMLPDTSGSWEYKAKETVLSLVSKSMGSIHK